MGLGTEVLFIGLLGALLLGPRRMAKALGHIVRAKDQLDRATRNFKAQLDGELEPTFDAEPATPYSKTAEER